jgi:hypothetical protein
MPLGFRSPLERLLRAAVGTVEDVVVARIAIGGRAGVRRPGGREGAGSDPGGQRLFT